MSCLEKLICDFFSRDPGLPALSINVPCKSHWPAGVEVPRRQKSSVLPDRKNLLAAALSDIVSLPFFSISTVCDDASHLFMMCGWPGAYRYSKTVPSI